MLESILDNLPCFIKQTSESTQRVNRPVFEPLKLTPPQSQEIRKNIYDTSQLRLWEEFINDGQEIVYIVQILECNHKYKGFPAQVLEYIEHNLYKNLNKFYLDENLIHENNNLRNKYVEEFIQILFQHYAMIRHFRLNETIKQWLDKFDKKFPDEITQPIKNLMIDSEWQWEV